MGHQRNVKWARKHLRSQVAAGGKLEVTWLYYVGGQPPTPLIWGPSAARVRLDDGYHSAEERMAAKAARNRDSPVERASKRERKITPPAFCEALLLLARHSALATVEQTGRIP